MVYPPRLPWLSGGLPVAEVARVIRQSAVKNIYKFPAIKAGNKVITLESALEQQYCLHLEFDPRVVAYRPQPKTFEVMGENGERCLSR